MDVWVAELVTLAMAEEGVNLDQLATLAAIPRVTLRRRLKEGQSFRIDELNRVASALGRELYQLIPGPMSRAAS